MPSKPTCGLVSLGCTKNLVDSEVMLGLLHRFGVEFTDDPQRADVLIVNTCTFLREADQESLDALREMAELKRTGNCRALVVTGCMVQREAELIRREVPEVDALLGTGDFTRIVEAVETALGGEEEFVALSTETQVYTVETPRLLTTPPWTAYVKIAEGCDQQCAFCVIPQVRGRYRSRPIEDIVAECERLTDRGVQEIVLLSQDSTRYGADLYDKSALSRLLDAAAGLAGLRWLRVLYWFPSHVTDELLDVMARRDTVCDYVDLPLQHADDDILRAMGRPGTGESNRRLIERLRRHLPDAAIRSAFIVGYPGETEGQFERLLRFVEQCRFDHVATFLYSAEPGTPAAERPGRVPPDVAVERQDRLMSLQQRLSQQANAAWVGRTIEVLIEETDEDGLATGRSFRDAPEVDGSVTVTGVIGEPGRFVRTRVTAAEPYALVGTADGEA